MAKLKLQAMSRDTGAQPRLATIEEVAREIGLPVEAVQKLVDQGALPQPLSFCKAKFDLMAIHAALDRISGLSSEEKPLDIWRRKRGSGQS